MTIRAPVIAQSARAGQFVRVLATQDGELIPLTLADWNKENGTIDLVIQGMGTSTKMMNKMGEGDFFAGIAGPLGEPSDVKKFDPEKETVVFTAGGVGLPAIYPIAKAHLETGNHVTMIIGFRSADHLFWTGEDERMGLLKAKYGDMLDVIYCSNDGTFGIKGFVTIRLKTCSRTTRPRKAARLRKSSLSVLR